MIAPKDDTTFRMAGEFLMGLVVEDWGCGTGYFKKYASRKYIGIDESDTPAVSKIAHLESYVSKTPGLLIRHVLEHNLAWEAILLNALQSFTKRMVLVLFVPFCTGNKPKEIARVELGNGLYIPTLSFPKYLITKMLRGVTWHLSSYLTKTQYDIEHMFFLEK